MNGGARLAALLACALASACAGATPPAARNSDQPATTASASTAAPTATVLPHVFVVVMENASLARATSSAAVGRLAKRYALATGYHAVARPSLPNYLALTSGSTWDVNDNDYHRLPATGIGAQLSAAGVPWRAYMEGMTAAGCMRNQSPYALKHNPFAYYGGGCPANVVPLDRFEADLAGATPNFVWITPDLCHDGHDCPIDEAGAWLEGLVTRIVGSAAWRERGVLFIVWDEGDGGDANLVPLIVASQRGISGEITGAYDHYSLLATIEDLFKLPRLGAAAGARPIAEVLRVGQ